jgi:epoxyqueuosine reductase QueG
MNSTDFSLTTDSLTDRIKAFVVGNPQNRLEHIDGSAIFEQPLVGVADGDDPLFAEYKTLIGPFHATPRELLAQALAELHNGADSSLDRIAVVSWVLPITEATRESNRGPRSSPSKRWAHTRNHGEKFNEELRRHVEQLLRGAGWLAVAPVLRPEFKKFHPDLADPLVSTWSERHAAYAAGLGTFSLNDAMITEHGIAVRFGSVVTNLPLDPNPRPYSNHTSNCLYLDEGSCADCIDRCPAGAISHDGHDKILCGTYCHLSDESAEWRASYEVEVSGCGLCQTDVPCEDCIPDRLLASPVGKSE